MKVLGVLEFVIGQKDAITVNECEGEIFVEDGTYRMRFSKGQAHGLMSILREHFKADPPKNGQFEFIDCGAIAPKDGPPEDTVALLCAAAQKWAKWDALVQAEMMPDSHNSPIVEYAKMIEKRNKWSARTLSYGHHLLSAGVADGQMESADLAVFRNSVVREFKRLDTLVENLRGQLAAVELSIGMEKRG